MCSVAASRASDALMAPAIGSALSAASAAALPGAGWIGGGVNTRLTSSQKPTAKHCSSVRGSQAFSFPGQPGDRWRNGRVDHSRHTPSGLGTLGPKPSALESRKGGKGGGYEA